MELTAHILSIQNDHLTPVVRNRIILPGSMSGLGMRSYQIEAPCAFIGCFSKVIDKIPDELHSHLPAYDRAVETLVESGLPEKIVPSIEQLIPAEADTEEMAERRSNLAQKLLNARFERLRQETEQMATGPEHFYIQKALLPMAGDFLFARITDPSCRMPRHFDLMVKLYLAIPACYANQVFLEGMQWFHCEPIWSSWPPLHG
jgi:hypothetical protein